MKIYQDDEEPVICLQVGDFDIKGIVSKGCNLRPPSTGIENICIRVIKENLKHITHFKTSNKN